MEQAQQILDRSSEQFMKLGIKSVSMDDLSSNLGISKKTIYNHFENKHDLVKKAMERHITLERQMIDHISENAHDAVHEMAQIAEHIVIHLRQIKPTLIRDLQKYYKDIWNMVLELQSGFMQAKIEDNIIRGMNESFYRPNLAADIVAKLYVAKSLIIVDESAFSLQTYNRDHLVQQHILYHLHGILTEKGRQHLIEFNLFNQEA